MAQATRSAALGLVLLGTSAVHAQTLDRDDWQPLRCADHVMIDARGDEPQAAGPRDIVGDLAHPAGHRAADDTFLYLRLRVDEAPAVNDSLQPFAWGFAFDLDDDPRTFELSVVASGGPTAQVLILRNSSTTVPNSPEDPADLPPVASYDFATHGRIETVSEGRFGTTDDHFLVFAVPWSALAPLGLEPSTPVAVWAATAGQPERLDGDLACHSGGSPRQLDAIDPDRTVLDPAVDSDGDGAPDAREVEAGTDPRDPAERPSVTGEQLEGGGGCQAGSPHRPIWALCLLALALGCVRRRPRRA
jgi:hypothetical protein